MTSFAKSMLLATTLTLGLAGAAAAQEAENPLPPMEHWAFSGPFGTYDTAQLQRGYQVYRQVCSNCHAAKFLSFRNLAEAGGPQFSDSQVKALAATFKVQDGPDDSGNMYDRPGRPSDPFPSPFANEQAARAANGGAYPPDMSTLAKARSFERGGLWFLLEPFSQYQNEGPDYIHALLNGYKDDPPAGVKIPDGKYYNEYFPGHAISMPPPLSDGLVDYSDGSPKTTAQYSKDVAAYLQWMAEPKLDQRKQTGFKAVIFLAVFAGLLFVLKHRIWAGVKDASGTASAGSMPLTDPKPRA
ncbi:cytochrome c1 [Lichenibacterium minor]|uniref:Cytochrome c1 n=1 Tax=Lichenibacterium minor TaxID=2316528 RepID=A0A4V1RVA6_9HYPH|nr:cytochrome c1 [Lichenibacterium minor]RYC33984.1 cytochrome c1 [Lichenibacterium minor]